MGSGNYARPYSPSRYEAWSLFEMGWVAVDTLASGRDVVLGPVASSDTVLYFPVPGTDEFYLLENRQAQESDTAQMNPDFGLRQKSPGIAGLAHRSEPDRPAWVRSGQSGECGADPWRGSGAGRWPQRSRACPVAGIGGTTAIAIRARPATHPSAAPPDPR